MSTTQSLKIRVQSSHKLNTQIDGIVTQTSISKRTFSIHDIYQSHSLQKNIQN